MATPPAPSIPQPAGPVVEWPREVEAHETNNALRRVLKDHEPQARDAATYVAAGALSLAALRSGEHGGLDAATMSFVVQCTMLEAVGQDLPEVQVVERPPRPPLTGQVEAIPKVMWLGEPKNFSRAGLGYLASVPSTRSGWREEMALPSFCCTAKLAGCSLRCHRNARE